MDSELYFKREHQSSMCDYYEMLSNHHIMITLPCRIDDKFDEIVILPKEDYDELKHKILCLEMENNALITIKESIEKYGKEAIKEIWQ